MGLIFLEKIQLYEKSEFFAKSLHDKLYRFNAIRRVSDNKFYILSCDPISSGDDKNLFLEREGYILDMLSTEGNYNNITFFDSLQDAVLNFLKGTELFKIFVVD